MRTPVVYWLLLVVLLPLVGCGSKRTVVVTDANGAPVAGALVEGVSASMNGQAVTTDAKGVARVPDNLQGIEWVNVSKPGYAAAHESAPAKWPLNVTLQAQPIVIPTVAE